MVTRHYLFVSTGHPPQVSQLKEMASTKLSCYKGETLRDTSITQIEPFVAGNYELSNLPTLHFPLPQPNKGKTR